MRDREDDMKMAARQHSRLLALEPSFRLQHSALWAASMAARVVPNAFDMTVWTTGDMATKFRGAAGRNSVDCKSKKTGQSVARKKGGKALREDRLDCWSHPRRGYHLRCVYTKSIRLRIAQIPLPREAGLFNVLS